MYLYSCGCGLVFQLAVLRFWIIVSGSKVSLQVGSRHGLTLWDQVRVPYARLERAYIEFTNELDTLMASSVSKFYFPYWFEMD